MAHVNENQEQNSVFDSVWDNNFDEFMRFLNDPNFDPNIRTLDPHFDNDTLLMLCAVYIKENGEKYLIELLKKKPNLDLQDTDGWTALMGAVRSTKKESSEESVRLLIDAGANLDVKTNQEMTALHVAIRETNDESTEETVAALINGGADLDIQDDTGWTALHLAVAYSEEDSTPGTVKMLINAGANTNLKNNENQLAIEKTDDLSLQLLLIKAGSAIPANNTGLIQFKKDELKAKIAKYKKLLNEMELELVYTPGSQASIEDWEKCLKYIKKMIKLRPGSGKVKEIEINFNNKKKWTLNL